MSDIWEKLEVSHLGEARGECHLGKYRGECHLGEV